MITKVALSTDSRGHMTRVLKDLLSTGWRLERVPNDARIPRNGMRLHLHSDELDVKIRIFAFKVTTSSRNKPQERRVELTTTYQGGLTPAIGYRDIVLGVDVETNRYVGIDCKRLHIGGATHNASSFFDIEGLACKARELVVNPRSATASVFKSGVEHHAFFDRTRMGEYLFSANVIHSGSYMYGGSFSGSVAIRRVQMPIQVDESFAAGDTFVLAAKGKFRPRPPKVLVEAFESGDYSRIKRRRITPADLKAIQGICEEVGALGEQVVLNDERRRLRKLGHSLAAVRVERISLRSVGEGYDIRSFEDDGLTPRYIEVKATVSDGLVVDFSAGEWKAAKHYGDRYYVMRVLNVRTKPEILVVKNPFRLEKEGLILRTPSGWRLDLAGAI